MSFHDIPTFPYRVVEPDSAAGIVNIDVAPLVPAERAFFLLMTSDEFQNAPQNFGSLAPEGRTLLPCLHAMVSIAISHFDNVYTRTPAYADRDASNIIFRTFEHPTKRGNFAILMQVNIGADPNPMEKHRDSNLHFCAPLQKDGGGGGVEDAFGDMGDEDGGRGRGGGGRGGRGRGRGRGRGADAPIVNDFMNEVDAVFEDGAMAMAGAPDDPAGAAKRRRGGGSGGRVSLAVRIYDIAAYSHCLFSSYDLGRMESAVNGKRLVTRPQPVVEQRDFRTLLTLPLRAKMEKDTYQQAFLKRVGVFGAALAVDPRLPYMTHKLPDDMYPAMQALEDPRFQLLQPYGLLRVATSLPNALARLRTWGVRLGLSVGYMGPWLEPSNYIGNAAVSFASPRSVPTFLMNMGRATMDGFLALPLPLPLSCEELLRTCDMQIALWDCADEPVLYEVVRAMNTIQAGLMRAHLTRGLIANLEARFGFDFIDGVETLTGGAQPPLSRTALFNLLVTSVMPSRFLHQNVFHLNDHVTKWRRMLLTPDSKPWELMAVRQMALRAFRDMHAAGVDADMVSRVVVDAVDARLGLNMADELTNFRNVFAMSRWSDLDHGAEHIAKFCMHLQTVTGARETWLELFIVMLASSASASLRFGKIHICLLGPAACGKSMIIEWAMKLAWPALTRSAVYESSAASRATDPTRESRMTQLAEESAGIGYYTTPEQRAVRISALSETVTRHRTIAINKEAADPRKQRVLVESNVWDCSSQIIATNVPPNREDAAAASRYAIRTMSTQPYSSQTYVEAHSAGRKVASFTGASQESILRAMRFFTLMMASVFTLDTIGAAEIPEYEVNIAILNAIMSNTTDASQVRRSKRLDRMTHVLGAWCGMFKFLLSPFSPLTLVYGDVLSLEALMRMPDFMSVSCAPGIFVASLSPLMHDDMFLRTIINILCTVVFKPRNSKIAPAFNAYMAECRAMRSNPAYTDVATQERAERMLLLRHICALFPLGPNSLTNYRDCVVFSIKTLEQYTANSGGGGGAAASSGADAEPQSAGFGGARISRYPSRSDIAVGGRDSLGTLRLMAEDSMDGFAAAFAGVSAAAAAAGDGSQQQQQFASQQQQMNSYYAPVYELLTGSAIGTAMEALADAIFPVLSASVYSGVKIVTRKTAALTVVKSEILEVLNRLQIKCLVNGMYTTNWRNLMIEDEGAALQKLQNFTAEYDVPGGTYVVAQVVHPSPRAEALNVVRVVDDGRRKALDALMNLHGGQPGPYIAMLASDVMLTEEDRARLLESLNPSLRTQDPSSWFKQHTDTMRRTGLNLVRSPACAEVLRIYNAERKQSDPTTMIQLFVRPAVYTDLLKRNRSGERLIAAIHGRGVGTWRRGSLLPAHLISEDAPAGGERRGLMTYHDSMKYHATQVNQALLPPNRRGAPPQRAQAAASQASASAAAAAAAADPPSTRMPIDYAAVTGTQQSAASLNHDDGAALEVIMDMQASVPPPPPPLEQAAAAADDADDFVAATPPDEYEAEE